MKPESDATAREIREARQNDAHHQAMKPEPDASFPDSTGANRGNRDRQAMKPESDATAREMRETRQDDAHHQGMKPESGPLSSLLSAPRVGRERPAAQTGAAPEQAHPVFQQALEILRREMPAGKAESGEQKSEIPDAPAAPPSRVARASCPRASTEAPPEASAPWPAPSVSLPTGPAPSAGSGEPRAEVIPARMLNEFVYCQRLFYYEFVEGVFVESADTLRGGAIHQRVDSGNGALPKAKRKPEAGKPKADEGKAADTESVSKASEAQEAEPETIHSRSVQMGSERLGVVAKMDLVEVRAAPATGAELATGAGPADVATDGTGGVFTATKVATKVNVGTDGTGDLFTALEVCPVDYKAGAPREGEEANELWDTDKMQLGLQALILRDNGYTCNEGVIYYRATKQRVRLPVTPELEHWILQNIAGARRAVAGPIPAPLVHSPKCVRCSLAPVCLPDETRMLAQVEQACSLSAGGAAPGLAEPHGGPAGAVESAALCRDAATTLAGPDAGPAGAASPEPAAAPRRLIAARDDTRPLYLNTQGYRVGCKDEVLQVKERERVIEEVRMRDVSHVALFGNIQISTQAIHSLCEQEVPVTYFSMGGWFYGMTRGHGMKNVFLRLEQFRLARDETTCLSLARQFVHGKIRNHRTLLMRNHLEPPEPIILKLKRASEDALAAASIEELLGIEGAAASQYFQQFSGMVKVEDDLPGLETQRQDDRQAAFNFNFSNRNRRPPTDPVNAMLSLAYSLLSKDCTLAALAVGFDPYVGFYHQPRFGRPALGLDLMEEFRPLVAESTVLSCINNRVVTERDFVRAGQAVNLTAPGRKRFFQTYEQRMSSLITHPLFDYKVSYRRALELQARLLAKTLTGEIAQYIPLMTR
jgi:CRISPR-associated protein Cas1